MENIVNDFIKCVDKFPVLVKSVDKEKAEELKELFVSIKNEKERMLNFVDCFFDLDELCELKEFIGVQFGGGYIFLNKLKLEKEMCGIDEEKEMIMSQLENQISFLKKIKDKINSMISIIHIAEITKTDE